VVRTGWPEFLTYKVYTKILWPRAARHFPEAWGDWTLQE